MKKDSVVKVFNAIRAFLFKGPVAAVAALLALAVALNMAAQVAVVRLDLTEGKVYSISRASKAVLKGLEDPVIIKGYFSQDLSEPYSTYREYLKDLLRSYKGYAGKNLTYEFVASNDMESFRREALQAGVAPVRLTFIARDKYEIKDGFMGFTISLGDKKEVVPVLRDINGLEYDLTSRIKKLASKESRVVWIGRGKGMMALE